MGTYHHMEGEGFTLNRRGEFSSRLHVGGCVMFEKDELLLDIEYPSGKNISMSLPFIKFCKLIKDIYDEQAARGPGRLNFTEEEWMQLETAESGKVVRWLDKTFE